MQKEKNKDLHPGKNPACDIAVFKKNGDNIQVLLVTRGKNSAEESGKLALPGGFQETYQKLEEVWKEDREDSKQGAVRELLEETTLNLYPLYNSIEYVGEYNGVINKQFDDSSWVTTKLFTILLPDGFNYNVIGSDDAEYADWYDIDHILTKKLAFDHNKKIIDSIRKLKLR